MKKLYIVHPYSYPEDYLHVYAVSDEDLAKQYLEWVEISSDDLDLDQFFEDYVVEVVNICGKEIKNIEFK